MAKRPGYFAGGELVDGFEGKVQIVGWRVGTLLEEGRETDGEAGVTRVTDVVVPNTSGRWRFDVPLLLRWIT